MYRGRDDVDRIIAEFRLQVAPNFPELRRSHVVLTRAPGQHEWSLFEETAVADELGVYLMWDDDSQLLYVGVTGRTFFKRMRESCKKHDFAEIEVIVFPCEAAHFAFALEDFLIQRLRPEGNSSGFSRPQYSIDWTQPFGGKPTS